MDYAAQEYGNSGIRIRDVQLVALEILCEVDRVCRQHNIPYQLFAGTLLGAVRHQGFIPWDDDIDIAMLRPDMERFMGACKTDLSPCYFLQTSETDPEYGNRYVKIRKEGTLFREYLAANREIHHGIFIDIFCLDAVKPGTMAGKWQMLLLRLSRRLSAETYGQPDVMGYSGKTWMQKFSGLAEKMLGRRRLRRWDTRISRLFENESTPFVNHLQINASREHCRRFLMSRGQFSETLMFTFEGHKFPGPADYHALLTQAYGDYMKWPAENERISRHPAIEVSLNHS